MTKFRKINDEDDIGSLACWIYSNKEAFFNKLFCNNLFSSESIEKLIMSDYINPYHRKFITLVYDEKTDEIQAIALSFKGSQITVTDTYNAFCEAGFTDIKNFLSYEYISIIFSSYLRNNDYYLSSIYVDKKYRKKYIGSKLVENIKQKARQSNSNNLLLDVSKDRSSLIDFYKRMDFEKSPFNYHTVIARKNGYISMIYKIK